MSWDIVRTEAGGIPVLAAEHAARTVGLLLFRVGGADEPFARSGLTHVVEHLALHRFGDPGYDINGFVDLTTTGLLASGGAASVAGFLEDAARSLNALPLERLEAEKRVLRTEAAGRGEPVVARLLAQRCGLHGHGSGAYGELGLRCLSEAEVERWAAERFGARNAVVCWAGPEPPPPLELELGDGPSWPLPDLEQLPGMRTPYAAGDDARGVAVGMLIQRSMAAGLAVNVLMRRLRARLRHESALVYDVDEVWDVLSTGSSHLAIVLDCLDAHAAQARDLVLEELDRAAGDGFGDDELAAERTRLAEAVADDAERPGWLLRAGSQVLRGVAAESGRDLLAAAEAVDARRAAATLADALESLVVLSPVDAPPPSRERFAFPFDLPNPEPVRRGREFSTKGLRASKRARLVVDDTGMTLDAPGDDSLTLLWDELVAATRERDGGWYLTARDTGWISFEPGTWKRWDDLAAVIEAHVRADIMIPPPEEEAAAALEELVARQLKKPARVAGETRWLAKELQEAEVPLVAAEAMRGRRVGLLLVTDRRTLFVYDGAEPQLWEHPHHAVTTVEARSGLMGAGLVLTVDGETATYSALEPEERSSEMVGEIRQRGARLST